MEDNEDSQMKNIFDIIQGGSYTETLNNINEMSKDNEVLRDVLLLGFYQNPNQEIHHQINSVYNKVFKAQRKDNWLCNHMGCRKPSTYSHELSERAVLSHIADKENEAFILKHNTKYNPFYFCFEKKNIRNILNFSGYCGVHDQDLFALLDNPDSIVDLEYVNLQSLRMLRRQIFELELNLRLAHEMISELSSLITKHQGPVENVEDAQGYLDFIQEKEKTVKKSLEESLEFYDELWDGIQSKDYIIEYDEIPCSRLGWVFSHAFIGDVKNCSKCVFSFIFKIDTQSNPVLIHAYNKNTLRSMKVNFRITQDEVVEIILLNKKKLALSIDFIKSLDDFYLESLILNEEFSGKTNNLAYIILFKMIFLGE